QCWTSRGTRPSGPRRFRLGPEAMAARCPSCAKAEHDWAIYEYTPERDAAHRSRAAQSGRLHCTACAPPVLARVVTMPRSARACSSVCAIDVGLFGRLLDGAHRLGAACERVLKKSLRALAALGRLCCFMVREASSCYCYQRRSLSPLPGTA